MNDWMSQGCEHCRNGVLTGRLPPPEKIATNVTMHARLHRCSRCHSWWIFYEQEAHVISEKEARETFEDYFRGE